MLEDLYRPVQRDSRTITPENLTGEPGAACMARPDAPDPLNPHAARAAEHLGVGWKVSPAVEVGAGESFVLADIEGSGVIRHIWLTLDPSMYRDCTLTVSYDGGSPAIEVPVGDFFCSAWRAVPISGMAISVGTNGGLNSYLPMPFRSAVKIELTNRGQRTTPVYWAIDYTLEDVAEEERYLHAAYRESTPVEDGVHTILDGVRSAGSYVGTFMTWQQHSDGWWGEGELKFYLDGDVEYPTITSTGTEDYFGGAWNFTGGGFTSPFLGFATIEGQNERRGGRHTMYRFHIPDPIHFKSALRVTVQALGWHDDRRYRVLEDDVTSVAYWYADSDSLT